MRFFEIAQQPRQVEATRYFLKSVANFSTGYPDFREKLRDFIAFRKIEPSYTPYGKKDYPFSDGALKGWRHCHIIYGDVILIYRVSDRVLLLAAVVNHKATDGQSPIASYLHGLTLNDFKSYDEPGKALVLSSTDRKGLHDLIYDLAGDALDRDILKNATQGQIADLMTFIRMVIDKPLSDSEKDALGLSAFGGVDGLRKFVGNVLGQTANRHPNTTITPNTMAV